MFLQLKHFSHEHKRNSRKIPYRTINMIKELHIQNFQSHKDSILQFHPGVNIIVGPTDSGKTAIIRALRWAVWNKPTGDSFRSHWGNETSVKLILTNGEITRIKGNSKNEYISNESRYAAFGTAVPEDISKVLNMNEINLQQQLDTPFLITNTSGEVALHFNKIANLESIDISTSKIKQWIREITKRIDADTSLIKRLETSLSAYNSLEQIEMKLEVLETTQLKEGRIIRNIRKLTKVFEEVKNLEKDLEKISESTQYEKEVDNIIKQINKKKSKEKEILTLNFLLEQAEITTQSLSDTSNLIELEGTLLPILKKLETAKETKLQLKKLNALLQSIANLKDSIKVYNQKIITMEKTYHKNMPDICPFCGSKINKDDNIN